MTPEFIIRKSLCRPAFCSDASVEVRARRIEDIRFAPAYAEPGYDQPTKGILFGNWNFFARGVDTILEKYGYSVEWGDEWTTCDGCNKALRTSADSYSWQPSYFEQCGEFFCRDCADIPAYLESLEDNPRRALNDHIDPAEFGYVKIEGDFQNGWHPGQNDDPKKIFLRLHSAGHRRLLFSIDGVGQFDTHFSIWKRGEPVEAICQ